MAVGDGWTSQLIAGLATFMHDNNLGIWRPTGTYTADEIAITGRHIPSNPDRNITLAAYSVISPPGMQDVTVGMQFRFRGTTDPRVVEDIADAVFEELDSLTGVVFGDIPIVQMYRQSHASLGVDANGRWEASHNYYIEAMRRTAHRTQ